MIVNRTTTQIAEKRFEEFKVIFGTAPKENVVKFFSELNYPKHDTVNTGNSSQNDKHTFSRLHHHNEPEIRLCLSSVNARFGFKKYNDTIEVTLEPYEFIMIPAFTPHYFIGDGEYMRFFKEDSKGWEPLFEEIAK